MANEISASDFVKLLGEVAGGASESYNKETKSSMGSTTKPDGTVELNDIQKQANAYLASLMQPEPEKNKILKAIASFMRGASIGYTGNDPLAHATSRQNNIDTLKTTMALEAFKGQLPKKESSLDGILALLLENKLNLNGNKNKQTQTQQATPQTPVGKETTSNVISPDKFAELSKGR